MAQRKILIVEDEGIVALHIENSLKSLGYAVAGMASSGEEAIKKAQDTRPDLVLMDIVLKGEIDGIEACEQIRTLFDIPVVFLTAFGDEDTLQRAKVTEPFGYILKPFKEKELHIAIDIALYKHEMESKLKRMEQWLAITLRSIGDGVIATDKMGCIIFLNPVAKILTGWKQEDALGKKLTDVYNVVNEKLINRDGNEIPIDGSEAPIRDEKGDISGAVFIFRDITQRKQMEDELKASEERYRRLFEVSRDGLFLLDKHHGHIIAVNQAGMEMLGIPREEILGKSLVDIGLFKDNALLQDAFQKLKRDGYVRCCDILIETKESGSIDAEVFLINRTKVIQCNVRDITERKKTEEMRLENDRLEYASKAKSEFLASMSHELRTPLNAIIGFSELMNMGLAGELSEKQKKYVSNISTSGNFLLNLINDILDMSKIESGKIELNIEKTDIPATIEDTIILIKEKASKQNIKIIKQIDPCIEFIEADKQRVKQILFNLLSNAVKFSKEEGGEIIISFKKVEGMAQISVSDTGIGIKPENLNKLFQKFEQLEKGISAKYGGTGLGLAISKQLVEMHGGKIWAESRYGEGSTFIFTLPLKSYTNEGK